MNFDNMHVTRTEESAGTPGDASYVAGWLEGLAADQHNQLSATGRRALRVAADVLTFLARQPGFGA